MMQLTRNSGKGGGGAGVAAGSRILGRGVGGLVGVGIQSFSSALSSSYVTY